MAGTCRTDTGRVAGTLAGTWRTKGTVADTGRVADIVSGKSRENRFVWDALIGNGGRKGPWNTLFCMYTCITKGTVAGKDRAACTLAGTGRSLLTMESTCETVG